LALGISTVPDSVVTGSIAVSPIAANAITGFSLTSDSSGEFSTSDQVVADGNVASMVYASDYISPTPLTLISAVNDMHAAYEDAKGRDTTDDSKLNLGAGLLGGDLLPGGPTDPLTTGVYTWGTDVKIKGNLHISGGPTDIFILQVIIFNVIF
jgi:hypothetical protein